jgi:hypothetical protein
MNMRSVTFLLFLFCPLFAFAQFTPETQEEDDLRYIFYNFKAAIDQLDTEGTAQYLDSNTLKFYEEVLKKIKTAEEEELLEMDFTSWYTVMFVRFMAPEGAIGKMETGKDLLSFMIRNALRSQLFNLEVMNIYVHEKTAIVYVMRDDEVQDIKYTFRQYGEADWRLDYTELYVESNKGMQAALNNPEVMKVYNNNKKALLSYIIQNYGWHQGGRDLWKIRQ